MAKSHLLFLRKVPSEMFDRALNTPLQLLHFTAPVTWLAFAPYLPHVSTCSLAFLPLPLTCLPFFTCAIIFLRALRAFLLLRALRAFPHLLMWFTCLHFFTCLTCSHLFTCPMCLHFFTCLTYLHFFMCVQFLTCFTWRGYVKYIKKWRQVKNKYT